MHPDFRETETDGEQRLPVAWSARVWRAGRGAVRGSVEPAGADEAGPVGEDHELGAS
jgi:hypothetical protein